MKTLIRIISALSILTMFSANVSHAAFLNLGTLDVRPVAGQNQNPEWFVEYADRGETMVRYIQIANFSTETKEVELYTTDSSKKLSENFLAKTREEKSGKIAPWMTMPSSSLVLNSGETKIVPVKITVPQNAGVGLHNGAVIVREKTRTDGTEFHIEKGVRVYLNVKGNAVDRTQILSGEPQQTLGRTGLSVTVQNAGTVDFDGNMTFELQNFSGETVARQNLEAYARPGEKASLTFDVEKPAFGFYRAVLQTEQPLGGTTSFEIGTTFVIPLWALLLAAAGAMMTGLAGARQKTKKPLFSFEIRALQKGASFLGILAVSGLASLPLINYDGARNFFAAVLEAGNPQSYEVTVKWGNLRKLVFDKKSSVDWNGAISLTDATATVKERLNFEAGDAVNAIENGTLINFSLRTDTNNDGIVLNVTPTSGVSPTMTFENYSTGKKLTIDLNKAKGKTVIVPNRLFAATIEVKEVTPETLRGAAILTEEGATPEAQATPEVTINIPELKSIFEDIPATPEVLSEFILTSDYVKKISTENALTKIETDSTLIRALEATPEIIEEIAATPSLNFTFVPSETVTFPAQQFSFQQDKTTTQDLGTIIFVQNKSSAWNTYIGTTNFVSLSGHGIIPAGNLKVIPGEAKILKQLDGATVNEGIEKNIQGTFDKSILVNVQPGTSAGENRTIFTMNPKLEVKIPRGTPPGKYRGLLTITSL